MTNQPPAGRRVAAHAAPLVGATPVRLHTHRALRLLVTAGGWAAGLCLIIASVVLVADATGPGRTSHVSTAAGRFRLQAKAGSSQPTAADYVLRTFAGIGNRITPRFAVAAHSRWRVRWLYQCTPGVPGRQLIIREGVAAGRGISVSATGSSGHGTSGYADASATAAARTQYLVVITNCAWTAQVLDHG
jgi:hypothetical protein